MERKNAPTPDGDADGGELLVVVDRRLGRSAHGAADRHRLEEHHDRDGEARPGSSWVMCPLCGATGVGRPDGTFAISARPCSSMHAPATSRMPPTTAIRAAGIAARRAANTTSSTIVAAEKTTVTTLTSPRCSTRRACSRRSSSPDRWVSPGPSGAGRRDRQSDTRLDTGERGLGDVVDDRAEPEYAGPKQDHADQHRERGEVRARVAPLRRDARRDEVEAVSTATGRRGADRQCARAAEQRVHGHRHHAGVEPDLHRQVGDRGVRHRLWDDDRTGRETADEVVIEPGAVVRLQPRGNDGHDQMSAKTVAQSSLTLITVQPRSAARANDSSAPVS